MSRRIFHACLYATSFALPLLPPDWHGKLIALTGIAWVFCLRQYPMPANWYRQPLLLGSGALLLISVIGLTYSENPADGLAWIETLLPLVILPLIIATNRELVTRKVAFNSIVAFIAGVICLNLASLALISNDLWDARNLQSELILANNRIVKIHPAYLSLYISFAVLFIIHQFFPLQSSNRGRLGWVLFSLAILLGFLIWLNSRAGVICFLAGALLYNLIRYQGRMRIAGFILLALITGVVLAVPFSRERFVNAPLAVFSNDSHPESGNPDIYPIIARKQILECAVTPIQSVNALYGYGTADGKAVLMKSYEAHGYADLVSAAYDAHNEYVSTILRSGLMGLLAYLTLLFIPYRFGLRHQAPMVAVLVVLFATASLFECVLSAQKGASFFALLCPLLWSLTKLPPDNTI
ncbi:MAG: O-antigen ligase family protein [Cyclobacteriaceae bacterium]